MDPARSIIRKLGGEARVSEITGTALTAPYRWQYAKERGGTGGFIPRNYHDRLLEYAKANDIRLLREEFWETPNSADGAPSTPLEASGV